MAATQDGPDTWLARHLLGSQRLEFPVLRDCLAESRRSGRRLEDVLVRRGLMPQGEVLGLLARARGARPPSPGLEEGIAGPLGASEVVAGSYRVQSLLGQGGMGAVYRVQEVSTGRELALKVLLGDLSEEVDEERFEREAEAAASLSQHPGFVQIHSAGIHRGLPYYAMELVEGAELESEIDALEPVQLASVVAQIARSLSVLHEAGFVHRDLKPANVLIASDGRPRILDLGLVRHVARAGLTKTGEVLGTPAYMAPEQVVDARQVDARSDVYALGAILYRGLSGRPPFKGSLVAVLSAVVESEPERPSSIRPQVPRALEAICLRALAKAPSKRYPSVADLAGDLESFALGELTAPPPRLGRWVGGAAALALAGGALALFLLPRPSDEVLPPSSSLGPARPSPTPDDTETTAEIRRHLVDRRFDLAKRKSGQLRVVPEDIRWALALSELSQLRDRYQEREDAAFTKLGSGTSSDQSDLTYRRVQAVRAAFRPAHACLQGLTGEHSQGERRRLATLFLQELRGLMPGPARLLKAVEAERGANLARLIHSLTPEREFSQAELEPLLPGTPFEGTDKIPGLRFAEALSSLDRRSLFLQARIASWAVLTPNRDVKQRLLPIADRAVNLAPKGKQRVELRILRLSCLVVVDGDSLLKEAGALLEEELQPDQRAQVLDYRSRLYFRSRDFAAALLDLDACLSLNPDVYIRSQRARVRRALGLKAGASSDALRVLLERGSEITETTVAMLGVIWDVDREHPQLYDRIARLVEQRETQTGWRLRLALLQLESGDVASAAGQIREAAARIASYDYPGRPKSTQRIKATQSEVRRCSERVESDPSEAKRILREVVAELDRVRDGGAWP